MEGRALIGAEDALREGLRQQLEAQQQQGNGGEEGADEGGGGQVPMLSDGVVYVANHQSWLDIFALSSMGIPLKFVSKQTIFYIPVVGWVMWLIGQVPLDRKREKQSGRTVLTTCTLPLLLSCFLLPCI